MNTFHQPLEMRGLEALRSRLRGPLLQPGDASYDEAAKAWNLHVQQRPRLVIVAEHAEDVLAAVRFARDNALGVGVMATGHGVGTPCDGGLLINTSRLRGVRVDPHAQTATVEAGALWQDVISASAPYGLAGLAGSAPHIGVVGYTMGGGFGWLGRKYGLNSASVTAAEIVTADGQHLHLSDQQNADLFWGLRGGGGNFGIVTSLEFRLYPLTRVYGGSVFYPVENAPEVLACYARWSAGLPDEMTTAVALMNVPPLPSLPEPLRGRAVVVVKGCYCGREVNLGEAIFRPVREGLGAPMVDTFGVLPVEALDAVSKDPVAPMGLLQYNAMLADLSPEAIDALLSVAGAESGSRLLAVEVRGLGGALARGPEQLSPMGSGDARYSLNVLGATFTPEMVEKNQAQITRLGEAVRPHQTGATFVNFMEVNPSEARVQAAYRPEDWGRLIALKNTYDPENRFRFNRNIPPSRVVDPVERQGS